MENQIQILSCKIGKKVSISYYDNRDGYNYNVENEEYPHPDLKNAINAFQKDLAESHYILGEEMEYFHPNGFQSHEAKGKFSVILYGKLDTLHDDKVTVKSGKIPVEEEGIEDKLAVLRKELYNYFFDGKTAQGKLFDKEEIENTPKAKDNEND